jgi:Fe-S oxidoreductase
MNPLAISLMLLLALSGFVWLAWRKLSLVAALAPAQRFDHPGARLRSVLVNGFLQQRMLHGEWRAGLMHAAIFIGFMALLLRKLQLLTIGYDEAAAFPAAFGGPFAAFKDGVELIVVAAVLYALWRRLVLRPPRLQRNHEALAVLLLILAIMLSDFAFDAFRFTRLGEAWPLVAHERTFAFIGGALANATSTLTSEAITLGYHGFYWLQMATVLGFLVWLPMGEHFHIVTALPALYFRRGRPARQVPVVDIDALMNASDEAAMKAGARTALDLTWKEGLDVFTCTECGRCKDACPTHLTGKPLSLKAVNDSLKHHLMDQRQRIVQGDPAHALPPLVGGVISEETLWACTSCGYCEAACPIELEHLDKFFRLRQHQVLIEGQFPHELKKAFEAWESQGNAWGLPSEQRGDWAQGLGVPLVRSAQDMAGLELLFYVGSVMSYDPRGQKIARAFVRVLQHAGVRFGVLGAREGSTGECARRLGNEMLFQQLAQTLVGTLNEMGVKRIVSCDPHAMNSLRHEYPEFGGHFEVLHHTTLMAELHAQGRLQLRPGSARIAYHDPCYLGRHNGEYDAPRQLLTALCGQPPLEFTLSRERAMCCGAGGGRMWLEEHSGKRINVLRAEQALATQAQLVATACPYCAVMMADGLAAASAADAVPPSRDIAELVADALLPPPATAMA